MDQLNLDKLRPATATRPSASREQACMPQLTNYHLSAAGRMMNRCRPVRRCSISHWMGSAAAWVWLRFFIKCSTTTAVMILISFSGDGRDQRVFRMLFS
jgi:hypothetical protein